MLSITSTVGMDVSVGVGDTVGVCVIDGDGVDIRSKISTDVWVEEGEIIGLDLIGLAQEETSKNKEANKMRFMFVFKIRSSCVSHQNKAT